MTTKTSATQRKTLAAGGQDSLRSGLITCTLTGKNCAVPSLHLDAFSAKEPGFESALASGNAYYHNCRAVIIHATKILPARQLDNKLISTFDSIK